MIYPYRKTEGYPYTNEELYQMFRNSNEANFVKFLLKLDEKLAENSGEDNEKK